ncbi:acyl-CoA dehydrogenase family protein [Actimicrobium sp. CCI2.3]|uniref:acyl-CoA dehydrogenase family protein n=1 Tax=Actimicrobium sp. CCI2.3 TaxID=3048616 RepID=UPI002AB54583|nr:acyl-CoA dehydrogenase family protein [Actimicrobium sp. CCI2.3]MDY7574832.1 acyl-CoA dehydrogenase family protein [Actimicrobium sp. CCI2.3]MEB0020207.1 acyl-CoA dehydrogenase family protein [Actimicrobium sp. CCI2.3]
MDFTFTQEQQQFSDALRRWVDKDYTFDQRKKIVLSDSGTSDIAWTTLTELGMTALPIAEEQGGFNGSAIDMQVVMHEIGRGLVIEPYWSTMLGAQFLTLAGGHDELLEQVAAGALKLACALGEKQSRYDLFDIATTATAQGDGFVLNGTKTVVIHGAQAGMLIVSARSSGSRRDTAGIALFVLPATTPGVVLRDYRTIDCQRAADITFTDVALPASALLGASDAGWDILDAATDYGITLLCAEAVGVMESLNQATLEYLKTRQQFGVPIGKFQALQHRMADMFMHLEQARSMATLAAVKVTSTDPVERRRTVSAAKARICQAMKYVGQQAVQLHGGMGVTNELPAAHHFKRLSIIELTLGDTDHHLARFIAQPGFRQAA